MPFLVTYTRRALPHWHQPGATIFITWRLYGSLPNHAHDGMKSLPRGEAFVRRDRILDAARTGPLWLNDERIAGCVRAQLLKLHQEQIFSLHAYVLMANHVHVLLQPQAPLAHITQRVKGATAREANQILARSGQQFWQSESFDHWIRTPGEWQKIKSYIESNPVKAGLVTKPEDWPWSSASTPVPPQVA